MRRRPSLTLTIIGLNTLIFFLSLIYLSSNEGWDYNIEGICTRDIEKFCFVPNKMFERPYSLITSAFLHADLSHLFFNMFALLFFGSFLERRLGRNKFIIIYFLSAIFGSLTYFAFYPSSNVPALGASAAIFGILGTLAILYPNLIVWVGFTPMPILFAAFIWGIISFFGIFTPSSIAHHAHLGGLLTGILIGIILKRRKRRVRIIYY